MIDHDLLSALTPAQLRRHLWRQRLQIVRYRLLAAGYRLTCIVALGAPQALAIVLFLLVALRAWWGLP